MGGVSDDLLAGRQGVARVLDQDRAALDQASGKVLQAKAALTQAKVNLDYTDIRAPIAGRIGRTAVTVGNLVNPAIRSSQAAAVQDQADRWPRRFSVNFRSRSAS